MYILYTYIAIPIIFHLIVSIFIYVGRACIHVSYIILYKRRYIGTHVFSAYTYIHRHTRAYPCQYWHNNIRQYVRYERCVRPRETKEGKGCKIKKQYVAK